MTPSRPYVCLTLFDGPLCPFCGKPPEQHEDFAKWQPPPIDDEYREKRSIELCELRGVDQ